MRYIRLFQLAILSLLLSNTAHTNENTLGAARVINTKKLNASSMCQFFPLKFISLTSFVRNDKRKENTYREAPYKRQ